MYWHSCQDKKEIAIQQGLHVADDLEEEDQSLCQPMVQAVQNSVNVSQKYRVRQDLNQEPPMGVISVLKHMSAMKKQRLLLPKEYRDKQDLIQEPAMGVISVLKHMSKFKTQRIVLPKEFRVKQDLLQEPPIGVISV